MPVENYLDCCQTPKLALVRTISDTSHHSEDLKRCSSCGGFWFYRFYERVDFSGGDDTITVWYSPVTQQEASQIMQTEGRPDLRFLSNRPSLIQDERGVRRTGGQPDKPWP